MEHASAGSGPEALHGFALHLVERFDEARAAVGVDVVVASVHGGGEDLGLARHDDTIGYGA